MSQIVVFQYTFPIIYYACGIFQDIFDKFICQYVVCQDLYSEDVCIENQVILRRYRLMLEAKFKPQRNK